MKILVTGSNGQLGSRFKAIGKSLDDEFIFTDSTSLDITNFDEVKHYFEKQEVDLILNCAAYTAVDQAEDDSEMAYRVNRDGVQNLVVACEKHDIKLIHFSTDYVFDGNHFKPYKEEDTVKPLGVYGQSKYAGEQIIMASTISALILRTSWLYAVDGHNFVKTMIKLGQEKEELKLIYDQVGSPTNAADLARTSLICIDKHKTWEKQRKIYHFSNEGVASWYDFALAIFEYKNINCRVKPVLSEAFYTKAQRPHYSVLDKANIKKDLGITIEHWKSALIKSGI